MFNKQYIQTTNFAGQKAEQIIEKLRNEDGEIASWMIVLAFLVAAAGLAKTQVGGAITTLIGETATAISG